MTRFAAPRLEWLEDDVARARAALYQLEAAPADGRWLGTEAAYRARLDMRLADLRAAERALEEFRAGEESAAELREAHREAEAA